MLSRFRVVFLAASVSLAHATFAQQPAKASFDVATIRPVASDRPTSMMGVMPTPTGIEAQFATVGMLVKSAYSSLGLYYDSQIMGLPAWCNSDRYTIQAKMSEADSAALKAISPDERQQRIKLMLQALLADRFQLKVHQSSKEVPDYELVVSKGGFKLQPDTENTKDESRVPAGSFKPPVNATVIRPQPDGSMLIQHMSLPDLANLLTRQAPELGRLVLDHTGLAGKYSFTLHWSPPHGPPSTGTSEIPSADTISIFAAIQEIGLKLQPSTGAVTMLFIDHVERPSAN